MKAQNIPTELLAPYLKALAQTQLLEHNYSTRPDMKDVAAGLYTRFPNQRLNPSAAQRKIRATLTALAECWDLAPTIEHLCYDSLAITNDTNMFHEYVRLNFATFFSGSVCANISRPQATHSIPPSMYTDSFIHYDFYSSPPASIPLDFTTDPLTYNGAGPYPIANAVYLWARQYDYWPPPGVITYILYKGWDPAVRTRSTEIINIPWGTADEYALRFGIAPVTWAPAVLWRIMGTLTPQYYWTHDWSGPYD
jgi:hypothetical protein